MGRLLSERMQDPVSVPLGRGNSFPKIVLDERAKRQAVVPVIMLAGVAVAIRAYNRRSEHPLHLPSPLQDAVDAELQQYGPILFSPPAAIDPIGDVYAFARGPLAPSPSSVRDDSELHAGFQVDTTQLRESAPGDGSNRTFPEFPVKGVGHAAFYLLPEDDGYAECIATICFSSAGAAERAGYRHGPDPERA